MKTFSGEITMYRLCKNWSLFQVQLFLDNNSMPECLPTFINMRSIQLRDIMSNFQERFKER